MTESIRVVLANTHPLMCSGIGGTLRAEPDLDAVGEACGGEEALRRCLEITPDVLLLDLHMPGPRATDIARALRVRSLHTRVLVPSAYDTDGFVDGLCAAGAYGCLMKDEPLEALLRAVAAGGT